MKIIRAVALFSSVGVHADDCLGCFSTWLGILPRLFIGLLMSGCVRMGMRTVDQYMAVMELLSRLVVLRGGSGDASAGDGGRLASLQWFDG